jgi:Highly conserved protein containing a thioredoxin domain
MFATISSREWGLSRPEGDGLDRVRQALGIGYDELETRWRSAVYEFVLHCYEPEAGALRHSYFAGTRTWSPPDNGNFLMAISFLAMYDRYQDPEALGRAQACVNWAYANCVETQPMFTWQGGVRDGFRPNELYLKYTSDALRVSLALQARGAAADLDVPIAQYHNFIKQCRTNGFAGKFDTTTYRFSDRGFVWNAFGGPSIAYLQRFEATGDERHLEHARAWADHGLTGQAANGSFYLIDDAFWNSDLTALELRSLVFLHEVTGDERYLAGAIRFADWLLDIQRDDGAWPLGIDRDGEVCAPNVGPGDTPNIAISLVRLHMATSERRYLDAAVRAIRYSLSMQAVDGGKYPRHLDDPSVRWGFWSWDPLYDESLSADQAVHHVRGMMIVADYLGTV